MPTDLLGLKLNKFKRLLINGRILSYRNEQAKLASMSESIDNGGTTPGKPQVVDPAAKVRAKRMQMAAQRKRNLIENGIIE